MKDLRFFVLDADDRIVQVGEGSPRSMAGFLGHSLWEYLPQAESLVRPHFDEARQTGHEVEATVFYAGGTLDYGSSRQRRTSRSTPRAEPS
jgi:hypothetical protein